ncbi:hypothetical protein EDEG_01746 [Edhazardia aedis USNM 41457]|uniref:Uncharacterized protein n=1 Tax=Edhazardia aedis (strain USNM 41457) TaxID=1003232 RepID=J9D900_EDHAE|nr:hypothetical protein EDEG_01746 [Edhazardia aedis USNM 41457]|eukprot:EJW03979.1 hypothetical protein EDEG_01746 [Edhazardia aedis USNM 41457]
MLIILTFLMVFLPTNASTEDQLKYIEVNNQSLKKDSTESENNTKVPFIENQLIYKDKTDDKSEEGKKETQNNVTSDVHKLTENNEKPHDQTDKKNNIENVNDIQKQIRIAEEVKDEVEKNKGNKSDTGYNKTEGKNNEIQNEEHKEFLSNHNLENNQYSLGKEEIEAIISELRSAKERREKERQNKQDKNILDKESQKTAVGPDTHDISLHSISVASSSIPNTSTTISTVSITSPTQKDDKKDSDDSNKNKSNNDRKIEIHLEFGKEIKSSINKSDIEKSIQIQDNHTKEEKNISDQNDKPFEEQNNDESKKDEIKKTEKGEKDTTKSENKTKEEECGIPNHNVDSKDIGIIDLEKIREQLKDAEIYRHDFSCEQGALHILNTITNNLSILKEKGQSLSKIGKIKHILIYKTDKDEYTDYWGKLKFHKKSDDKSKGNSSDWVDETGIFEGDLCEKFEDIPEKGILTPNGFFQSKKLSSGELGAQFTTIKIIIEEIAQAKNTTIPVLFKENNDISITDRLIFAHSFKEMMRDKEKCKDCVRVCVCTDNFCKSPCEDIRWVDKKDLK